MESAQNPGYFAPRLASNPWATGGGRQAHRGCTRLAGSNRLQDELQAANCAPAEAPIGLDFTAQKSECPVMPKDTRVGRNVVLDGLDFASLRRVWEQTFGAAPPRSLSRVFLGRVLLHERQCRTHGWHSATTRRILAAMVNGTPGNGAAAPAGSVSAGTHLVREWNGRTYQVEVLDNGYRFDGKTYPSLTAITKRITGTHWSGPRFFGLMPKRKA